MITRLCGIAAALALTGCSAGSDGFVAMSPPPAPSTTASTPWASPPSDFAKVMSWTGNEPTLSDPFELGTTTAALAWWCDGDASQAFAVDVVPRYSQQQGQDLTGSIKRIRADVDGFSGVSLFRPDEAGGYQLVVVNVLSLHPCRVSIRQRKE